MVSLYLVQMNKMDLVRIKVERLALTQRRSYLFSFATSLALKIKKGQFIEVIEIL